jgi:DNA-binding NarL/FixJ family response regulator
LGQIGAAGGVAAAGPSPRGRRLQPSGAGQRAARRGPAHGTELTQRQQEVARLVAQGLTNKQIARSLRIGQKTVGTHVEDIFNRLGFQSRAQVAAWVGMGMHAGLQTLQVLPELAGMPGLAA